MLELTTEERAIASGEKGDGAALALRIVIDAATLLEAERLIPSPPRISMARSITAIRARSSPRSWCGAARRSRCGPRSMSAGST